MKILDYLNLKTKHKTLTELAEAVGVSVGAASKHASGASIPRPKTMERYREVSDGLITAADFYPTAIASSCSAENGGAGEQSLPGVPPNPSVAV